MTALRDRRFWQIGAALLCLLFALTAPRIALTRPSYKILVVIDITGSMNTRDQKAEAGSVSRLDFVKRLIPQTLAALPCQSQAGLALFTERRSFLLMEPVEICANFSSIQGTIAKFDWRMAWEGDSHISKGLSDAIATAESLDADLLFLTDGQEAPPQPEDWESSFEAGNGRAKGLIAGVGGYTLSPIPKFDPAGREIGFYNADDVPHESRLGPPPKDAETREGYHPRNAPWGAAARLGTEHLSSVREDYLKLLASKTGLGYAHLESADGLTSALADASIARPVRVYRDVSVIPAAFALILFSAAYLPSPVRLGRSLAGRVRSMTRKGTQT
jgi:mxaL protein